MLTSKRKSQAGFSLVEMAMSIIISGLVFTMVLAMMKPLQVNIPIEQTSITLREVEAALKMHVERYGRLPCPASINLPPNDSEYGRETDCTTTAPSGVYTTNGSVDGEEVRIGMVPIRNLDLPEYYARDGWDNRLTYAVTTILTDSFTFSNNAGDISVMDINGFDMLGVPGSALFVVVSHGPDEKGATTLEGGIALSCVGTSDKDTENCDFFDAGTIDADFMSSTRSEGTDHYDDMILYKTFVGSLSIPDCGNRGMIHAPGHPESDPSECLDPGYKSGGAISINGVTSEMEIDCPTVSGFCENLYQPIDFLSAGDYLIHWDVNLKFDHPMPEQYAKLEFKAGDIIHETEPIPFIGDVCNLVSATETAAPVQSESGLMQFNLDAITQLEFKVRYFGGNNVPSTYCAAAIPPLTPLPTPTLHLVRLGSGTGLATEMMTLDILRKPQTFGMGPP